MTTERSTSVEDDRDTTQLRRIEALSSFALYASDAEAPDGVLRSALELVLALFSFDQAVAFIGDGARLRGACAVAKPGLSYDSEERVRDSRTIRVGGELPFAPRIVEGDAEVLDTLASLKVECDRIFAGEDGEVAPTSAVLMMPLRSRENAVIGLLIARTIGEPGASAWCLGDDLDRPFLALTARHVESAFENARLRSSLAQSEARVRAVLDALPGSVFVVRGGHIVFANEHAGRFVGAEQGALVGASFAPLLDEAERAPTAQAIAKVLARAEAVRLLAQRWVGADGQVLEADVTLIPVVFDEAQAVIVVADDRAERLRMRTQLIQADRLASVGALAAGVAHEINNPLAFIMLNLDQLAKLGADSKRISRAAKAAIEGASRIRGIVSDLKTFSRVEDERRSEVIDINGVLETVLAMAANELRYRANIERDYAERAFVRGSEGRLAQVFLNLVINAAHAIPEGECEQNLVTVRSRVEGEWVHVEVIDTGVGISPDLLPRMFEPFYSSKPLGQDSGLGLSISRNIIESHQGRVAVESAVGEGTRFIVRLPRSMTAPDKAEAEGAGPCIGACRLLIVDDEEALLIVLKEMLEGNHEVITASSGAEAVEILAKDRSFDVILCDLMMPRMSGADVFAWLEEHAPELALRTVFMTGGVFTPRGRALLARCDNAVLAKPFTQRDLFTIIESSCQRGRPGSLS